MRRTALTGAFLGLGISLGFWIASAVFGYMFGPETVVLWPSSIVLMGLEGQQSLAVIVAVWVGSVLINVTLYALLALGGYAIYRVITK